jgi:hypothetical protein
MKGAGVLLTIQYFVVHGSEMKTSAPGLSNELKLIPVECMNRRDIYFIIFPPRAVFRNELTQLI